MFLLANTIMSAALTNVMNMMIIRFVSNDEIYNSYGEGHNAIYDI